VWVTSDVCPQPYFENVYKPLSTISEPLRLCAPPPPPQIIFNPVTDFMKVGTIVMTVETHPRPYFDVHANI
jgi:hypothetical protein